MLLCFDIRDRRVRQFAIERLPVSNAAAQERRPCRHGYPGLQRLGKKAPEVRVMPAEVVPGTVPVRPYARAKPLHLGDEFLTAHRIQVVIHQGTI
jgi:hypothetical protein